ncbi:MAG: flagellar export chaperone FliS [Planctomycetia bacterium]|nr:flagellar export chaperone FliS [Planctomycetia bacterium]
MPTIANAYLESQVMTASAERLHQMVIDAAIRFARQAEAALDENRHESAFVALNRCRDCVNEILTGISSDPNPALAEQLRGLFIYVCQNLTRADLARDAQFVREAIAVLEWHRSAWLQLVDNVQKARPDSSVPDRDGAPGTRSWTT